MRSFLLIVLLAGLALPLRAADVPDPLPGSRTLRTFDFEETKLGNYEATPMYWSRVVGRGYPAYSSGRFDHSVSRSANTSFLLETNGGSVAYRFNPPAGKRIPVNVNADYLILAFVRTAQLRHARADLAAWFTDEAGNLIPSSEAHSHPAAAEDAPAGGWQVLQIFLAGPGDNAGDASKARSLILQMGLLQPQQLAEGGGGLGRFEIYEQDIKGSVWFDDIVIFQLPRVAAGIPQGVTGGMFSPNQRIDLDLVVSDLGRQPAGGKLSVGLKIADADGVVFANERWPAVTAPDQAWTHRYSHGPLPAGMYTATLDVAEGDGGATTQRIAARQTRFLCLPAVTSSLPGHPAPEFGLGAANWGADPAAWAELPTILRQCGAGLVQLPAWRRDMSNEALTQRDRPLDVLLGSLQRLNVRAVACFSELPASLSDRIVKTSADRRSVLALLDAPPAVWKPYFSFLLTRYASRIDYWELGSPDAPFSGNVPSSAAPLLPTDDADRYARLYHQTVPEILGLLNHPHLIVPWNALFDFDAKAYPDAVLDLRLPAVIKPAHVPTYIDNFRQALAAAAQPAATQPTSAATQPAAVPILAHLEPLDEARFSRRDRLDDFAQRVVLARTANPMAILVDLPHSHHASTDRAATRDQPDELFLVYRTLIAALGESSFTAELPLAPGLRALLFDRHGSGTLILWNQSAQSPEVPIDLPLGATPRLVDLLGNIHPVSVDPASGLTHLSVTATPLILDQLDPRPLRLRSSFVLSATAFPAGAGTAQTDVLLTNPYTDALAGTLRIVPPRGWTADPATLPVALAPGATLRQPVTMHYPFNETAGPKNVHGRLTLDAASAASGRQFDLEIPAAVTSDLVDIEGFTQIQDDGALVIQQMITNVSDTALNAQAYAMVPGYQYQTRYLMGLQPGQTTIKRFVFPPPAGARAVTAAADLARALAGKSVTLGLRQSDGKTLITKSIALQ